MGFKKSKALSSMKIKPWLKVKYGSVFFTKSKLKNTTGIQNKAVKK